MKIALDVDGVLLNWFHHNFRIAGFEPPHLVPSWNMCMVPGIRKKIFKDEKYWSGIEPLSDPKDIDFPVHCYLTSIPEKFLKHRAYNLAIHGFPIAPVVCSHDKARYCHEHDIDVLVDDKPGTIQSFIALGMSKNIIQFYPHYADWGTYVRYGIPVAYNMTDVSDIIKNWE